jgi:hypothetical protein
MRGASWLVVLALLLAIPAGAGAATPWPPADGPGSFFIHFGEEHWNDDDSDLTLIRTVRDAARYGPDLVTMSGDKANDGTVEQLTRWKEIMGELDRAGVPYLMGVGNHDRLAPPGVLPGTAGLLSPGVQGSFENYRQIFADRPYPLGDAAPYSDPGFPALERPAGDPDGASSHYFADYRNVRWIFIDNSCWGIRDCDSVQNPPFPDGDGNQGQFEWLEQKAKEATQAGKVVFVVMHIPTRDPRDQSYIETTSFTHVMGKDFPAAPGTPDNDTFEEVAERGGVDGVFVAHIKGQFTYEGLGDVPYYIDGGAGGELYTEEPVGVNHGYWHGYRLLRVGSDGEVRTDVVPILSSITIRGADRVQPGERVRLSATGKQLDKRGARVDHLSLQDPDPVRPSSSGVLAFLGELVVDGGGWIFIPPLLLALAGLTLRLDRPQRRLAGLTPAVLVVAVGGAGAAALAAEYDDTPTSTPRSSLPNPARIWTSANPFVLAPDASGSEDPRRNPRTQTQDGAFQARCPGRTRETLTAGFEEGSHAVHVPSKSGPIARRIRIRGRRARVRLVQPAEVLVRVRRRGRTVRTLRHRCSGPGTVKARWNGKVRRGGRLRRARRGTYKLQVLVRSDRRPLRRAKRVRIG